MPSQLLQTSCFANRTVGKYRAVFSPGSAAAVLMEHRDSHWVCAGTPKVSTELWLVVLLGLALPSMELGLYYLNF